MNAETGCLYCHGEGCKYCKRLEPYNYKRLCKYWLDRCLSAEKFLHTLSYDPRANSGRWEAFRQWQRLIIDAYALQLQLEEEAELDGKVCADLKDFAKDVLEEESLVT